MASRSRVRAVPCGRAAFTPGCVGGPVFARSTLSLQVENLVENEYREVPAALMDEIMRFLRPLSRKLMRALTRNVARDAVRVLDVRFDAQELLMRRPVVVVLPSSLRR